MRKCSSACSTTRNHQGRDYLQIHAPPLNRGGVLVVKRCFRERRHLAGKWFDGLLRNARQEGGAPGVPWSTACPPFIRCQLQFAFFS